MSSSESSKSPFYEIAKQAVVVPQEQMVKTGAGPHQLKIGIPKESFYQEKRISITPHGARQLVNNGHEVYIETGAGLEAKFSDNDYSETGAQIAYDRREVFKCDVVLKVAFPSMEELGYMGHNQTLISTLYLPLLQKEQVQLMQQKRITAIAFEMLKDVAGNFPVRQSMSEIAGSTSILIAAEYLSNINHGRGVMLGGIPGVPPSQITILGAGTAALSAAKAAFGLGAEVKVFDFSVYRLRRLQQLLQKPMFTSVIEPTRLGRELAQSDVAIGALRATGLRSPSVVTEEMVAGMRNNSVIVDLSIDQGGCFETSEVTNHQQPTFVKHGVIHYGVPNVASRVSRTASYALGNIFTPMLLDMGELGGIKNYLWEHDYIRHSVYLYRGNLTNQHIAEKFHIPSKEIDLLIAANV
jgi:alanine dehydrogenase